MKRDLSISVVDDDESMRESLESLLKSMGFRVALFPGAEEFLDAGAAGRTDCLILDVRLAGMSGPELQKELSVDHPSLPVIFITGHGTEALRQKVIAAGAVDCLFKPFSEDKLLGAVEAAAGLNSDSSST